MLPNNDGDTTNRKDFNKPIQYGNYSPNNNSISITTGVDNQEPITYKHQYTLFVFPMTPQLTNVQDMQIKNIVYVT